MKYTQILGIALLTVAILSNAALAADTRQTFDFEKDGSSFTPMFADYPSGSGVDDFYELKHEWTTSPTKDGKALFLSGNNHSDDLFMGYYIIRKSAV